MKHLFLLFTVIATVAVTKQATAQAPTDALLNDSSEVTASGYFLNSAFTCNTYNGWPASFCPSWEGWYSVGYIPYSGYECCVYMGANFEGKSAVEVRAAAEDSGLEEVFSSEPRTTAYWGYVNSANRSPSSGRTVAKEAKLDACIGHGDVDYIKASVPTFNQLSTCRGSSYCGDSLKNQNCTSTQSNGETICQDRCDCVFGGTCDAF